MLCVLLGSIDVTLVLIKFIVIYPGQFDTSDVAIVLMIEVMHDIIYHITCDTHA